VENPTNRDVKMRKIAKIGKYLLTSRVKFDNVGIISSKAIFRIEGRS
jgi:hypothetical protein